MVRLPPVLLVAVDPGTNHSGYYQDALGAIGLEYAVHQVAESGAVTEEELLGYETVIWFASDISSDTFRESDQAIISQYIQSGGRLLVSGQDIGYDLKDSDFLKNVLGAQYVKDSASTRTVTGAGLDFAIEGGDGANNQRYPDVIALAEGQEGELFMNYAADEGAAIRFGRGSARVVYLGFGFEGVSTAAHRMALLQHCMGYLRPGKADVVGRLATIRNLLTAASPEQQDRYQSYATAYQDWIVESLNEMSDSDAFDLVESANLPTDLNRALVRQIQFGSDPSEALSK